MIEEIRGSLKDGAVIVSVIAALSIAELAESLSSPGKRVECFRVIPNTAIRYGKSVTFISHSPEADKGIVDEIESIFNLSGESFIIPEKDMPARHWHRVGLPISCVSYAPPRRVAWARASCGVRHKDCRAHSRRGCRPLERRLSSGGGNR